jgi:hypothetical protein
LITPRLQLAQPASLRPVSRPLLFQGIVEDLQNNKEATLAQTRREQLKAVFLSWNGRTVTGIELLRMAKQLEQKDVRTRLRIRRVLFSIATLGLSWLSPRYRKLKEHEEIYKFNRVEITRLLYRPGENFEHFNEALREAFSKLDALGCATHLYNDNEATRWWTILDLGNQSLKELATDTVEKDSTDAGQAITRSTLQLKELISIQPGGRSGWQVLSALQSAVNSRLHIQKWLTVGVSLKALSPRLHLTAAETRQLLDRLTELDLVRSSDDGTTWALTDTGAAWLKRGDPANLENLKPTEVSQLITLEINRMKAETRKREADLQRLKSRHLEGERTLKQKQAHQADLEQQAIRAYAHAQKQSNEAEKADLESKARSIAFDARIAAQEVEAHRSHQTLSQQEIEAAQQDLLSWQSQSLELLKQLYKVQATLLNAKRLQADTKALSDSEGDASPRKLLEALKQSADFAVIQANIQQEEAGPSSSHYLDDIGNLDALIDSFKSRTPNLADESTLPQLSQPHPDETNPSRPLDSLLQTQPRQPKHRQHGTSQDDFVD